MAKLLLRLGLRKINAVALVTVLISERRALGRCCWLLPGRCLVRKHRVDFEEVLSAGDDGAACSF